jgi:hypothetical protein
VDFAAFESGSLKSPAFFGLPHSGGLRFGGFDTLLPAVVRFAAALPGNEARRVRVPRPCPRNGMRVCIMLLDAELR